MNNTTKVELITTLVAMAIDKCGQNATAGAIVEYLYANCSLTDTTMRQHVVGAEYFRLMRQTKRTSHDIEQELAERFGISPDGVRYIRNNFARGGSRRVRGPKAKR